MTPTCAVCAVGDAVGDADAGCAAQAEHARKATVQATHSMYSYAIRSAAARRTGGPVSRWHRSWAHVPALEQRHAHQQCTTSASCAEQSEPTCTYVSRRAGRCARKQRGRGKGLFYIWKTWLVGVAHRAQVGARAPRPATNCRKHTLSRSRPPAAGVQQARLSRQHTTVVRPPSGGTGA